MNYLYKTELMILNYEQIEVLVELDCKVVFLADGYQSVYFPNWDILEIYFEGQKYFDYLEDIDREYIKAI